MTEEQWEQEYEALMEAARKHLEPAWDHGEVAVLKTVTGNVYVAQIPDYWDPERREPLENQCMEKLRDAGDTQVLCCLATVNGRNPEILSWNFRDGLIRMDERNLDTEAFLWGGEDLILVKPFRRLLPPDYKIK